MFTPVRRRLTSVHKNENITHHGVLNTLRIHSMKRGQRNLEKNAKKAVPNGLKESFMMKFNIAPIPNTSAHQLTHPLTAVLLVNSVQITNTGTSKNE